MRPTRLLANLFLTTILTASSGCTSDDYRVPCPLEPGDINPGGATFDFVIDAVDMPSNGTEVVAFGLNLDCGPEERPDNAMGQILSTVFNVVDVDLDDRVQTAIDDGRALHLLSLQTTSLDDAADVGFGVFLGNDSDDDPTDNFSGHERFEVEGGHATEPLTGYIADGHLSARLGAIPLRVALPHVEETFVFELHAVRVEAEVMADGIAGTLGGAISDEAIDDTLIPVIHTSLSASVAEDCIDGVCEPDSHGRLFLDAFDENADGQIDFEELQNNSLVRSLLAPDNDLFDEDGSFRPRCDGRKESLSFGVAFTAVPARFSAPR